MIQKVDDIAKLLRAIVDTVHEPAAVLDQRLQSVLANQAFSDFFGARRRAEGEAQPCKGEAWSELLAKALATLKQGTSAAIKLEVDYQAPQLGPRLLLVKARNLPVRGLSGEPCFVLFALQDITARREAAETGRAKELAERASKEKSRFLATMSHEIRTPLAAIAGFSELLEQDPAQTDLVGVIRRNAKHLTALIDDILDLSKVESGQISLEKIPLQVREEINGVLATMAIRAKDKGLDLHCSYEGRVPHTIYGDPTRLRQILINMIGNAIKFTDRGQVSMVVRGSRGRRLVVHVADSGCGIAPEHHERIFEPFCQAAASTTRTFGGTGLGLTLSRQLARVMGGDIVLKESSPGRGSLFELVITYEPLPKEARLQARRREGPIAASGQQLAGLKLLLVEDRADNRLLFERMLSFHGAQVRTASDGEEGVAMASAEAYDCILMDLEMPRLDGRAAAARLRSSGCHTPILALTAHACKEERDSCLASGMNEYCTKPIGKEALCRVVARWCKHRASQESWQEVRH